MPRKSRSQTSPAMFLVSETHWSIDPDGTHHSTNHTSGPWGPYYNGSTEEIVYGNGKQHANPCDHVKAKVEYKYLPPFTIHISAPLGYTVGEDHTSVVWVNDPVFPPAGSVPRPGFNMFQFYLRAFQNARPKFRNAGQLVNDILEIKDLARLVPHGKDLDDIMRALRGVVDSHVSWDTFLSRLTKAVSGQYLNLQFGILTTISAVFDFASGLIEFNQKLKAFRRGAGKKDTFRYKESFSSNDKAFHTLGSYLLWSEHTETSFPGNQEYHSTIVGSYSIGLSEIDVPKIFRKYMGFRNDPKIIWNAIPFSFIVDWFLGVSRSLDAFDEGAIPVSFTVESMVVSRKYDFRIDWVADSVPPSGLIVSNDFRGGARYCRYEGTVYSRWLLDREVLGRLQGLAPLPTFGNLSGDELILGGALGAQRLR